MESSVLVHEIWLIGLHRCPILHIQVLSVATWAFWSNGNESSNMAWVFSVQNIAIRCLQRPLHVFVPIC